MHKSNGCRIRFRLLSMFLLPLLLCSIAAHADDAAYLKRRLDFGINLFPNVVSVDLDVASKQSKTGQIILAIVYEHDGKLAEKLAGELAGKVKSIRKLPVSVVVLSAADLGSRGKLGGVFIAEPLDSSAFDAVMAYGISEHAVVFSPYAHDVDRGVMTGFVVASKILPSVSEKNLEAAGIRLHPLFLKLAKRHEP